MINNKILIIDDEQVMIDSIKMSLEKEDYEIISASNGKEGLKLFEREFPILIMLDMKMPVMNGIEFLEHVKIKHSDRSLVIVLTGHGDEADMGKCFGLGISAFLRKPFNVYELRGMVKHSMELKRTQCELMGYRNHLEKLVGEHTAKLKESYADLKASQAMMIRQEKITSLGQLAAGVALELNNPVGSISSNLVSLGQYVSKLTDFITMQVLAMESIKADEVIKRLEEEHKKLKVDNILGDIKAMIRECCDGIDRIQKIVQYLKIFLRPGDEKLKQSDINKCLESTLGIVWNELKYNAAIKKEYGKIPLVKCCPEQMSQVFMNLLVNASQAIDKNGEITIKTWHKEDSVFVSISDTGCGIPEENLNKILDPFFTTEEVGKGTGLGLSISHEIIKKHNGEISIHSEVGKGTTFTVRLPA